MARALPLNEQQAIMQEPCQGCYYFSGWNCDYILMEKTRRPCRPGDECTVRKKRGASREESLVVSRRLANKILPPKPAHNRDKKPYTVQVKHPRPVIKAKPATKTVFNQTKKPKPKAKPTPKPKPPSSWEILLAKLNTPEVIRMYEAGDSDVTIGKVVGCCGNSVRKWRIQTGRPCHGKHGPQSVQRRLDGHLEDIRAALAAGATTTALAERYGVHRETIRRFRKVHEL